MVCMPRDYRGGGGKWGGGGERQSRQQLIPLCGLATQYSPPPPIKKRSEGPTWIPGGLAARYQQGIGLCFMDDTPTKEGTKSAPLTECILAPFEIAHVSLEKELPFCLGQNSKCRVSPYEAPRDSALVKSSNSQASACTCSWSSSVRSRDCQV